MKNKLFTLTFLSIILGFQISAYSQLLPPTNLTAEEITWMNNTAVKLEWDGHNQMERYNVYKKHGGINDPGDFIKIANHIMHRDFIDHMVMPDSTYSYYVTAVNQTSESDPSETVEITISGIQTDAIITGILYNELNNDPIAGGKVRFTETSSCFGPTVTTNQYGEFIAHLLPGNYYMRSMAMGFIPEFYDNVPTIQEATIIIVNSGDSLNFDIALAPFEPPTLYTLSGNVTDTMGNPLHARIIVTPIRMNSYFHHHNLRWTVTDSLGNYSIPVKDGDTVVVFCKPFSMNYLPEYYDNKHTFAEADRIPIMGDVTGIDFIIEPAPVFNNGISGSVMNEINEGVEAHIAAFKLGNFHHIVKYRTVTDSLGSYNFSNMIPGEYILLAIPHEDYMPTFFRYDGQPTLEWNEADSVLVEETGVVTGINFIVHPFEADGYAQVIGTIKDNLNNPINGAVVFAVDQNNNIRSYAISNSNGEFTMEGFEPGVYTIIGDKFGFSMQQSFDVTLDYLSNLTEQVAITLTPEGVTSNDDDIIIEDFELSQNFPNPFNPVTSIKFSIPEMNFVSLKIYDVTGKEIKTLVNSVKPAGTYQISWNAENNPSGVYFYTLRAGNFSQTKKMLLLK